MITTSTVSTKPNAICNNNAPFAVDEGGCKIRLARQSDFGRGLSYFCKSKECGGDREREREIRTCMHEKEGGR